MSTGIRSMRRQRQRGRGKQAEKRRQRRRGREEEAEASRQRRGGREEAEKRQAGREEEAEKRRQRRRGREEEAAQFNSMKCKPMAKGTMIDSSPFACTFACPSSLMVLFKYEAYSKSNFATLLIPTVGTCKAAHSPQVTETQAEYDRAIRTHIRHERAGERESEISMRIDLEFC